MLNTMSYNGIPIIESNWIEFEEDELLFIPFVPCELVIVKRVNRKPGMMYDEINNIFYVHPSVMKKLTKELAAL